MTEPTEYRSHEINSDNIDFQTQISAIANRSVTPDNIENFGQEANRELLDIVKQMIIEYYNQRDEMVDASEVSLEDQTFWFFNMDPDRMRAMLNHFERIAQTSELVNSIFSNVDTDDSIFVHPDSVDVSMVRGSGTYREKKIVPRAEVIAILLMTHFDIDLKDKDRVRISEGKVDSKMMRKKPYILFEIDELNRIVLVCEEEGNRTFIYDKAAIEAAGLDVKEFAEYSKRQHDGFIADYPGAGIGFRYSSENFSDQVVSYLKKIEAVELSTDAGKILKTKPDTWKFRRMTNDELLLLANDLKPGESMNSTDMNSFSERGMFPKHGTIISRFGSIAAFNEARGFEQLTQRGLTDEQIIGLADQYFEGIPVTQEGIDNLSKAGKFVSSGTIHNRFGGLRAFNKLRGFDTSKLSDLSNEELLELANELSPGVWLTVQKANELSRQGRFVSAKTVSDRFGGMIELNNARGFDKRYDGNSPEHAPADYRTLSRMEYESEYSFRDLTKALGNVEDQLGVVETYKNQGGPTRHYSLDQQTLIYAEAARIKSARPAQRSVDRVTAGDIADIFGYKTDAKPRKLLKEIGAQAIEELVGIKPSLTYDKTVVDILREHPDVIKNQTVFAPAGVEAVSTVAKGWNVAPKTIFSVANKYHVPIGSFKFGEKGARVGEGLWQHDKDYLHELLEIEHYFEPEVTDDDYTWNRAANALGLSSGLTVKKYAAQITETDSSFGEIRIRKASNNLSEVLSGNQLEKIRTYMTEHGVVPRPRS